MDWIIALDRSIIFSVQDMVVTPWLTPLMRFISFIGEYTGIFCKIAEEENTQKLMQDRTNIIIMPDGTKNGKRLAILLLKRIKHKKPPRMRRLFSNDPCTVQSQQYFLLPDIRVCFLRRYGD